MEIPINEENLPLKKVVKDPQSEDLFQGIKKKTAFDTDVRNPKAILQFQGIGDNFSLEIGKNEMLTLFQQVEDI